MTTTTHARRADSPAPATATTAPSTARLWLVELRKLVDTPAGIALAGSGVLLAGVFGGGAALFTDNVTYGDIAELAGVPLLMLLPVLTILLATSGRHHRIALTSYTLVPVRGRVLVAQTLAAAALGVLAAASTLAAALLIAPVGSLLTGRSVPWTIDWPNYLALAVGIVLAAVSGYAVGLATGLAPVAITIVLAWPAMSLLLSVFPSAAEVLAWLDVNAVATLTDGITGVELAQVATGVVVWIVLPGLIGALREVRTEVR